ncbi:MAG: hypothetical protein ACWGPN_16235 [Gammaproteobacteria bacterium]
MADFKQAVDKLLSDLRVERDELRLKMGLAKLEAMDQWHMSEAKLAGLEAKAKELGGATGDASKNIAAAAKLLAEEIRDGFKSVAKKI